MKQLHIGNHLSLPLDAATQTFAFIARKGAGKTYAAGKLCEELLEANVQSVILDTVGNWYGLRLAANGKDQGFDIPVVGGLRGDIPLEATAGELIADIVVDTGRSLILDLSQFSLGERKRFATTFGQRLWKRKKGEAHPSPLMLFIEESQLIVPQHFGRDEAQMVGIYEEIIRLGRNYGIGCTMISQRPQSINKEVLNQTECLFVGQVNGSQERDALKKWIVYQGMSTNLVDELPSLQVGNMYVWSPQWLQILEKVKIGTKKTYDASATPKVGEKRVARELKPLDLDDLKQKMVATIERAKAEDPRELRRKIGELERQLRAKAPAQVDPAAIEKAVAAAIAKNNREWEAEADNLRKLVKDMVKTLESISDQAKKQAGVFVSMRKWPFDVQLKPAAPDITRPILMARPPVFAPRREPSVLRSKVTPGTGDASLGKAERKILTVLATHGACSKSKLAILAGYSQNGGAFNNPLGKLRTAGFITPAGSDPINILEAGHEALGGYEPLPTGSALLEYWKNSLGHAECEILRVLSESGQPMAKNEIAELTVNNKGTPYEAEGGAFNNPLGKLRTLGLVTGYGSQITLCEELRT